MTDVREEDSIGRSVYEHLVRLTFLCGRGLPLPELMNKFLKAMRPTVPASAMWLYREHELFARSADDGLADPPPPATALPSLAPTIDDHGLITAYVMPGVTLLCQPRSGPPQRACDVISLLARIVALAWQAETLARAEPWPERYLDAKSVFKRRWLRELLERHHGNVSAAARAAEVSRAYLYEMMQGMNVGGVTQNSQT